ncbi:TPA: hypothetical protein N0F65_007078 [Lagenidium giganteum]|uniref:UBR-type domain-containing protein n=1 Tax=Lagenidium giganteum TaxID=4803 RepID=A0AAV2YP44_9STRA|nr:TPA: hypothetical protein N0F65_007078 [Lagenidium giganteum]
MTAALYACLTCTPPSATNAAGICLACSYHCHADHELVELYTKRSFKCDCGNSKFPKDNPCKLFADKPPVNDQNKYSQNFFGTYCTCHRPYPDPERTTPEVMVQCVICEDWLHEEHVFPSEGDAASSVEKPPLPEDYDEMICAACVKKHPFLLAYVEQEEAQDGKEEEVSEQSETTDKENEEDTCFLTSKATLIDASKARPTFWLRGWRESLCQCKDCVRRYEVSQLTFLLDPEDSLQEYEEKAKQQRSASTEEAAQKAFQTTLSHEQQVEMAMGYNHMKQSLQQYLAKFAQEGKTVRAEDIKSFFEELRQTKRPRTEEN